MGSTAFRQPGMPANRPLVFTALNGAVVFAVGFSLSQKGASFNDLILISNTDVEGGSFFVLGSNFGFVLGSLCAGFLYEIFRNRTLLVAMAMTAAAVGIALTPLCRVLAAMIVANVFASVFTGGAETISNALVLEAWDGKSQSAMQFLSFCFSTGGIVGPLISEPFMAPKADDNTINKTDTLIDSSANSSSVPYDVISAFPTIVNSSSKSDFKSSIDFLTTDVNCSSLVFSDVPQHNVSHCEDLHNNRSMNPSDLKSNLVFAYMITAILFLSVALLFYAVCIKSRSKKRKRSKKEDESSSTIRSLPMNVHVGLAALSVAFYYFHAMIADSFGQYLFFFVVTHLDWDKTNGAIAVSILYSLAMCMKLFLIWFCKWVSLGRIILVSTTGMVVALSLFTIAGHFQIDVLMWISVAVMAFAEAAVYGGGFSWIDGNLVKVNGKMTSALNMAAGLGAMSAPIPLGYLMKELSPMAFPYYILTSSCLSAGIFIVMCFVVKPIVDRKYGPLRVAKEDSVPEDDAREAMAIDSNHQSNASHESCSDTDVVIL